MATFAGRWEAGTCVIRVRCRIIRIRVTARTSIWRIVEIAPYVASGAVIGDSCVPSGQHIKIIVIEG